MLSVPRKSTACGCPAWNKEAIRVGFDNLIDGAKYDSLSAAATCRERADWIMGISATRLYSVLYNETLNTGRVQSPTLAMIVKRDADIAAFVKVYT